MLALELAAFWLTPGAWGAQQVTFSITLSAKPAASSGVTATTRTSGTVNVPCNFPFYLQGLQPIPTSKTAVNTGNVTPLGYCILHNTDDFNFISLYSDNAGSPAFAQIDPGGYALWPLSPTATIYAKADTAACNLEIYTTAR